MAKRRVGRYAREFRATAVARMLSCDNICALARELGVNRALLYQWRGQAEQAARLLPEGGASGQEDPRQAKLLLENGQLKRALAERSLEVDFFKAALQKVGARRRASASSGARASTTRSGK